MYGHLEPDDAHRQFFMRIPATSCVWLMHYLAEPEERCTPKTHFIYFYELYLAYVTLEYSSYIV